MNKIIDSYIFSISIDLFTIFLLLFCYIQSFPLTCDHIKIHVKLNKLKVDNFNMEKKDTRIHYTHSFDFYMLRHRSIKLSYTKQGFKKLILQNANIVYRNILRWNLEIERTAQYSLTCYTYDQIKLLQIQQKVNRNAKQYKKCK